MIETQKKLRKNPLNVVACFKLCCYGHVHKYHTIVHLKKTKKKFFLDNFCVPELYTLKFLTQKRIMVTQISAASSSPNFHSGKSYVKKNNSVYF